MRFLLALEGLHAVEVFNNGTEHLCHGGQEKSGGDMLLPQGKRVFPPLWMTFMWQRILFGGWIWVKAVERSREPGCPVPGTYYSSTGPEIYDFGLKCFLLYGRSTL